MARGLGTPVLEWVANILQSLDSKSFETNQTCQCCVCMSHASNQLQQQTLPSMGYLPSCIPSQYSTFLTERHSGIKNISKDKSQEKTTLEKTLTGLPDSPYICADKDRLLKIYLTPDTMLPTGRWNRDGAWKVAEGGMRRQWEKQQVISVYTINTKNESQTSGNTGHTVNYVSSKFLSFQCRWELVP